VKIDTKFDIRDRVIINGDATTIATVQRISIGGGETSYEVSWFDSNGALHEHYIWEWQLELATPKAATIGLVSVVSFDYINYWGECSRRCVSPLGLRYGVSGDHSTPQFLLRALDRDKDKEREFAICDMSNIPTAIFL
jgi:hypothetical protein